MSAIRKLSGLFKDIVDGDVDGDTEVRGLTFDSRCVETGYLFMAVPGSAIDGRRFIADAVANGAVAVLYEAADGFTPAPTSCPQYPVHHLANIAGTIADRFFGSPSKHLTVIGVTGTNGKTTVTQLLSQALNKMQRMCAVIGTLGNGFPDRLDTTVHTTPDVITVHSLLARYISDGASFVCIEVSSHALAQGRVNGVAFDIAVFTNLTRDHLDYHGDMESYSAAKARLFSLPGLKIAVINGEDDFGQELIRNLPEHVRASSYGLQRGDIHTHGIAARHQGLSIEYRSDQGSGTIESGLFGRFNAANLLAVLAVLLQCGIPLKEAEASLSQVVPIAGRMERFGGIGDRPLVVVDYAHTPDALEKVLQALRENTRNALWCVFGCGGDRDRGKRPQMGAVAERLADHVVLTDDNPRHEDPDQIIRDIGAGMRQVPEVVHRRRDAIRTTLDKAGPGDIVLVAGKGHENYQQIGDDRIDYSDRETVTEILGEAA